MPGQHYMEGHPGPELIRELEDKEIKEARKQFTEERLKETQAKLIKLIQEFKEDGGLESQRS